MTAAASDRFINRKIMRSTQGTIIIMGQQYHSILSRHLLAVFSCGTACVDTTINENITIYTMSSSSFWPPIFF